MASLPWGESPSSCQGGACSHQALPPPGLGCQPTQAHSTLGSGRAPRGLRRGDLIHLCEPEASEGCFCFGPGGLVHKAPGPHPLSGRDRSQPPTVGPLLAHSSPPLSSPCEQPCVSLPTQSDTWFLLLPSAPSSSLLFSRFFSLGNPHPSFVYSLHPCLFLLLSPALCSFSLHPPRPPQDRQHQESRDCAPLADHCIPRI